MPKIIKPTTTAEPASTPPAVAHDFLAMGHAVALRNLAEANGLEVAALKEHPALVAGAGLPADMGPHTWREAHRLHRDMVDAVLWRADVHDRGLRAAKSVSKGMDGLFQ